MNKIEIVWRAVCYGIVLVAAASAEFVVAADDPGLCELMIDGQSIVSLRLVGEGDRAQDPYGNLTGQEYRRPGKSLQLPAGRYRVVKVEVEGGFEFQEYFGRHDQWFELTPDEPHQLVCGAPLTPSVTVKRHGKFLQMDCELVDRAGRSYVSPRTSGQQLPPPRFNVYKNDELLGSESFAYG